MSGDTTARSHCSTNETGVGEAIRADGLARSTAGGSVEGWADDVRGTISSEKGAKRTTISPVEDDSEEISYGPSTET